MTTSDPRQPIGVFDSGVGGLSILREIRRELPGEDLLYVADSAFAPYGDRPAEFIERRAVAIVRFLITHRAKAIVVACNTATGAAVTALRAEFALPIVAIEPAIKPAAAATKSGVVGVLATSRTLASDKFLKLVNTYSRDVRLLMQPCPGLVDRVEDGDLDGPETRALVERYVRPLVAEGADTIVLGCTHYHFVEPAIRAAAGPDVTLIDPATAVARECRRRLDEAGLRAAARVGRESFWTSGEPDVVRPIVTALWAENVTVDRLPDEYADRGAHGHGR